MCHIDHILYSYLVALNQITLDNSITQRFTREDKVGFLELKQSRRGGTYYPPACPLPGGQPLLRLGSSLLPSLPVILIIDDLAILGLCESSHISWFLWLLLPNTFSFFILLLTAKLQWTRVIKVRIYHLASFDIYSPKSTWPIRGVTRLNVRLFSSQRLTARLQWTWW